MQYISDECACTCKNVPIPSAKQLDKLMKNLSDDLCDLWANELGKKLTNLEFQGCMSVTVSETLSLLPNIYVQRALCKLQDRLDDLEYEYVFKFDDINISRNWTLHYEIELPEDLECIDDSEETTDGDEQCTCCDHCETTEEKVDSEAETDDDYTEGEEEEEEMTKETTKDDEEQK